tara:strand:+ start:2538 stop:3014 length:477 start_codon:yes stop_codon:yes gene_type:complete
MKINNNILVNSLDSNIGLNKKIGIVKSIWNNEITERLLEGCRNTLLDYGVQKNSIYNLSVPGSFELIYGGKKLYKIFKPDAIILIGSIIQGETPHFQFISQATANGVKDLNILFDIPFVFCVSTDLNEKQAIDRSGGKIGNKGVDAALTALHLLKEIN